MADLNKAKSKATTDAMRRIIYLMLYILIDKHNAPEEDILQLAEEFDYYSDSISSGYISWRDVEQVVVEEYGVEVPW